MSSDLKASFERAAEEARTKLPSSLPGKDKISLYGLFKQATEGPCKGDRPGVFSQVARYKYDSWNNHGDKSTEVAMQEYIDLVESLKEK